MPVVYQAPSIEGEKTRATEWFAIANQIRQLQDQERQARFERMTKAIYDTAASKGLDPDELLFQNPDVAREWLGLAGFSRSSADKLIQAYQTSPATVREMFRNFTRMQPSGEAQPEQASQPSETNQAQAKQEALQRNNAPAPQPVSPAPQPARQAPRPASQAPQAAPASPPPAPAQAYQPQTPANQKWYKVEKYQHTPGQDQPSLAGTFMFSTQDEAYNFIRAEQNAPGDTSYYQYTITSTPAEKPGSRSWETIEPPPAKVEPARTPEKKPVAPKTQETRPPTKQSAEQIFSEDFLNRFSMNQEGSPGENISIGEPVQVASPMSDIVGPAEIAMQESERSRQAKEIFRAQAIEENLSNAAKIAKKGLSSSLSRLEELSKEMTTSEEPLHREVKGLTGLAGQVEKYKNRILNSRELKNMLSTPEGREYFSQAMREKLSDPAFWSALSVLNPQYIQTAERLTKLSDPILMKVAELELQGKKAQAEATIAKAQAEIEQAGIAKDRALIEKDIAQKRLQTEAVRLMAAQAALGQEDKKAAMSAYVSLLQSMANYTKGKTQSQVVKDPTYLGFVRSINTLAPLIGLPEIPELKENPGWISKALQAVKRAFGGGDITIQEPGSFNPDSLATEQHSEEFDILLKQLGM